MVRSSPVNLDRLRIIAALFVTSAHARSLSFEDFNSITALNPANFLFYWSTSLGHPSVLFFFVLSGYLVGGGIVYSAFESRFVFSMTLINRLTRIWIVLIPSLLVAYILNLNTCHRFPKSDYCQGNLPHNLSAGPIPTLHEFSLFMRTTLFLVKKREGSDYFGGNQVLWSLQYEIAAYFVTIAVAAIISMLIFARKETWARTTQFTISTFIGLFCLCIWLYAQDLGFEFLLYFSVFILGIASRAIRFLPKKCNWIPINTWTILLSLIFFGQLTRIFPIFQMTGRVSISDLLFSVLIAILLSRAEILKQQENQQRIKLFNLNFSFSLYLTHFPMQGLIVSAYAYAYADASVLLRTFIFIQLVVVPVFFAKIFAYLTEDRTYRVRQLFKLWMTN
jgi:peptidoglycan/LPS O-acetylase OafA/YrhL